jgi:hypothetical protein
MYTHGIGFLTLVLGIPLKLPTTHLLENSEEAQSGGLHIHDVDQSNQ